MIIHPLDSLTLMIIHPLDSLRYGREYLIRYRIESLRHVLHRVLLTEYHHSVPYPGLKVSQIEHAHVHADTAHYRNHATVEPYLETPLGKMSVQTVGISYGDDSYTGGSSGGKDLSVFCNLSFICPVISFNFHLSNEYYKHKLPDTKICFPLVKCISTDFIGI